MEVVLKPSLKRGIGLCQTVKAEKGVGKLNIYVYLCARIHTHRGLGGNKLFGKIRVISSITLVQVE